MPPFIHAPPAAAAGFNSISGCAVFAVRFWCFTAACGTHTAYARRTAYSNAATPRLACRACAISRFRLPQHCAYLLLPQPLPPALPAFPAGGIWTLRFKWIWITFAMLLILWTLPFV